MLYSGNINIFKSGRFLLAAHPSSSECDGGLTTPLTALAPVEPNLSVFLESFTHGCSDRLLKNSKAEVLLFKLKLTDPYIYLSSRQILEEFLCGPHIRRST